MIPAAALGAVAVFEVDRYVDPNGWTLDLDNGSVNLAVPPTRSAARCERMLGCYLPTRGDP